MNRPVIQAVLVALTLSGCAYYSQAVGTAKSYYDAKAQVWFDSACTLNIGAVGRLDVRKRMIINAACPPITQPMLKEPE